MYWRTQRHTHTHTPVGSPHTTENTVVVLATSLTGSPYWQLRKPICFTRWLWNLVPAAHDSGRQARPFTQSTQLFCMPSNKGRWKHTRRSKRCVWKCEVEWTRPTFFTGFVPGCSSSLETKQLLTRGMWWSSFPNLLGRSHAGQCNLWKMTGLSNRYFLYIYQES